MFVEAPSIVVFVLMQMSLGLTLNVIVGFSMVDGRWRGREAILDLDFTIRHRCKCQFCQKRFSLRVLALRRVCKQMTIVAMRPCCKTGAKVVLRRSTTLSTLKSIYIYIYILLPIILSYLFVNNCSKCVGKTHWKNTFRPIPKLSMCASLIYVRTQLTNTLLSYA